MYLLILILFPYDMYQCSSFMIELVISRESWNRYIAKYFESIEYTYDVTPCNFLNSFRVLYQYCTNSLEERVGESHNMRWRRPQQNDSKEKDFISA